MSTFPFRASLLVQGKVKAVAADEITLAIHDDKAVKIVVGRETDIRVGQKQTTLSDFRPGDHVTVAYRTLENRHVATAVRKD
jgi:hypothetical protein